MTGQLGDVMGESGRIALHYVRSHAEKYGIAPAVFEESDIHVHFPAGAIPKDGPSAGSAIASAILSLLTGRTFPADLAMTGELTLVGEVLPIGGVREKVLAARRLRLKRIVLPVGNRKDVEELKRDMKEGLTFVYVETFKDVFREVFGELPPRAGSAAARSGRPAAARSAGARQPRAAARKTTAATAKGRDQAPPGLHTK
jgi:ATP-dependent Lon protease